MKERKTIGFLINEIDGNYHTYLWLMMKRAAEKLDCNLIVYEGGTLQVTMDANIQHHIVYDFVDQNVVDGLIISSGPIAHRLAGDELNKFCNKYASIPLVSIGLVIPHVTSMIVDNKEGMKSLIRHLIEEHGYKKIAFVTGPSRNVDSIERFEAYLEVLEENRIEVDKSIIFNGNFTSQTGYSIMKDIILRNVEYDVIVFANDDMALAAMKCLKDLKKSDVMDFARRCVVCGFDDSINSSLVKPSLTTVRQPLEELCHSAIETLLRKIEGEKVEDVTVFPSVLVKRESCGCKIDNSSMDLLWDSYLRLTPAFRIHENMQTYFLDELFDSVTKSVEQCLIRSCFISKYCEGTITYDDTMLFDGSSIIPDKSELIYSYYNNRRTDIDSSVKYFRTKDIVPERFFPKDRRFIYLVNPLFFKDEHFGFVCFEIVNDDVINFEPLRGQMSNMLKGALMLLEREKMEESLREIERLAALGHLIGGISHNLMTPIMSISGACVGLKDLVEEYKDSIGDNEVTLDDHYEIANDMLEWINKLKEYTSYMSNVISTVKKQAVQLNADTTDGFTIEELIKYIVFFKNNNVEIKRCNLNLQVDISPDTSISGEISNLMQVINNLIVNAVQSYEGINNADIKVDLHIFGDSNFITFAVRDYGKGIQEEMKNKIFKYMVTSKGKNGTGLSLLLSYSTIKGKCGGEMWFESGKNQGTTFYITIPIDKK
ncbi:MAG: substrate-binding domain-containing protein [Bacillota bacterium]